MDTSSMSYVFPLGYLDIMNESFFRLTWEQDYMEDCMASLGNTVAQFKLHVATGHFQCIMCKMITWGPCTPVNGIEVEPISSLATASNYLDC